MIKFKKVLALVSTELMAATAKNKPFNSTHEGYAVILEEMDELWEEIKHNPKNWDKIKDEAVQVAAMGLRFVMDCCKEEKK